MAKSKPAKKAAAAAAIQITADCPRDADGYGALPFVDCNRKDMAIGRPGVSALKALLLKVGFESNEVSLAEHLPVWPGPGDSVYQDWHEDSTVTDWEPRKQLEGDAWTLVAVLYLVDGDGGAEGDTSKDDAVAIFARPAGLVDDAAPKTLTDAEAKPWPFPKTEGGGPEVQSETIEVTPTLSIQFHDDKPAAPATMTRQEASARKPGRFELLEPTDALLKTFTPRVEKHGEDDVSAASLGLQIEAPNTILDLLSSSLRPTLYAAADNGAKVDGKPASQRTIEGVEESTPLLRTKVIETLKLNNCYEGWTLRISWGFEEAMTISECKVDKFVVTPKDGGSVILDLRVGSSDIGEDEAGWLYGKLRHNIEITLHAPEVKAEPIDGTQAAFERDHPPADERDAGDLFAEQHGRNADGSPQEPDDPDGSGEREAEEQAS